MNQPIDETVAAIISKAAIETTKSFLESDAFIDRIAKRLHQLSFPDQVENPIVSVRMSDILVKPNVVENEAHLVLTNRPLGPQGVILMAKVIKTPKEKINRPLLYTDKPTPESADNSISEQVTEIDYEIVVYQPSSADASLNKVLNLREPFVVEIKRQLKELDLRNDTAFFHLTILKELPPEN